MTTMKNVVEVPRPLFDKMCEGSQCGNIAEGFVSKTFFFQNKEIVTTGTCSSGKAGWISCWGHYVVDMEDYREELKPLSYNEHYHAVNDGLRERGYRGQKTKFGKRTLVFIGENITFKPVETGIQLELF